MASYLKALVTGIAMVSSAAAIALPNPGTGMLSTIPKLSDAAKLGALKNAGVILPAVPPITFTLSVSQPSNAYGFLYYLLPGEVVADPAVSTASFTSDTSASGQLEIHWKPKADTVYLLDCQISSKTASAVIVDSQNVGVADGHVLIVKKSPKATAADMSVRIEPPFKASFAFRSCAVTLVNM